MRGTEKSQEGPSKAQRICVVVLTAELNDQTYRPLPGSKMPSTLRTSRACPPGTPDRPRNPAKKTAHTRWRYSDAHCRGSQNV